MTTDREPCLVVLSAAIVAAVSVVASFAFVVIKAYICVRNFEGPPCHWIKGHLDQVSGHGPCLHQSIKF